MVVVALSEGDHTIEWSLAGYNTLTAVINVSAAGTVTCKSVTSGTCGSSAPPGVTISGSTVTAYMKTAAAGGICPWITGKGGPAGIRVPDIFTLEDAYLGFSNPGFTPTIQQILGTTDYYLGFISSGNSKTGCSFT